ncbi:hypothetical protein [Pseudomonas atacamensis]|uniref:hypothetical protein n=1 Tax=Pseudomonas atacamensis TaxID=2565368 RepID=UPI0028BB4145|nr:hypothetical protein [Pseudomonas atacamensis]MDT6919025.1 hypothetical protein [Pseudomonas atacamensis]
MQTILDLIANATMQAWIWGPLMGVVFGALFAGITNSPAVNAPVTVTQTRTTFVTNIVVNQRRSGSGDDGSGAVAILIAAGLGMIFVVWKYAIHIELVHYCLWALLSTLLSFSMTTALVSLIKGQFTSSSWCIYIAAPIVILAVCGRLLMLAKASFDHELTRLASQHTFWDFYAHSLSSYGQSLMIFQVLGVVLIFLVMVLTGVALLHYLALMNQRSYGPLQGFWMFLTGATMFFSGRLWFFVMAAGLGLSYVLIEPSLMPTWATQR